MKIDDLKDGSKFSTLKTKRNVLKGLPKKARYKLYGFSERSRPNWADFSMKFNKALDSQEHTQQFNESLIKICGRQFDLLNEDNFKDDKELKGFTIVKYFREKLSLCFDLIGDKHDLQEVAGLFDGFLGDLENVKILYSKYLNIKKNKIDEDLKEAFSSSCRKVVKFYLKFKRFLKKIETSLIHPFNKKFCLKIFQKEKNSSLNKKNPALRRTYGFASIQTYYASLLSKVGFLKKYIDTFLDKKKIPNENLFFKTSPTENPISKQPQIFQEKNCQFPNFSENCLLAKRCSELLQHSNVDDDDDCIIVHNADLSTATSNTSRDYAPPIENQAPSMSFLTKNDRFQPKTLNKELRLQLKKRSYTKKQIKNKQFPILHRNYIEDMQGITASAKDQRNNYALSHE